MNGHNELMVYLHRYAVNHGIKVSEAIEEVAKLTGLSAKMITRRANNPFVDWGRYRNGWAKIAEALNVEITELVKFPVHESNGVSEEAVQGKGKA